MAGQAGGILGMRRVAHLPELGDVLGSLTSHSRKVGPRRRLERHRRRRWRRHLDRHHYLRHLRQQAAATRPGRHHHPVAAVLTPPQDRRTPSRLVPPWSPPGGLRFAGTDKVQPGLRSVGPAAQWLVVSRGELFRSRYRITLLRRSAVSIVDHRDGLGPPAAFTARVETVDGHVSWRG
jgi:hypothetical protein